MNSLKSTGNDAAGLAGFWSFGRIRPGSLGNRLVFQILAISAALSLFTSSIQLYSGYQHDRQGLSSIATTIERSVSAAFSEALWEYNFELAEALLDGVYTKEHVEFARLETPQGRVWEQGASSSQHVVSEIEFTFREQQGTPQVVGTLTVGISTEAATNRLWEQAWIVLLTNFLKAFLASFAISILFEWNVARHLRKVAEHVSKGNWQEGAGQIQLERKHASPHDDIERVVNAIHSAKQRAQIDFALLSEEVALRKKAQERLRRRTEELENVNREQAAFTYAISHDLKSPANTLGLLLQELRLLGADNLDSVAVELLDDMELTTARMATLIDDVLHYASTVETKAKRENVDLNVLFHEICADLKGDIRNCNAVITSDPLPEMTGDRTQLRLLLQNLIANALKFRAKDIPPEVRLTGFRDGNLLVIEVSDNGIGISEEHHERIFTMFKRLYSQSQYEGTGLGLTLCKRVVLNHDGEISISSKVGLGTTFRMEFKV